MNYPNSRSALYKETAVNTASPTKLVVMLYEGAVRFLTRAARDIRNQDLVGKAESISRALAIIQHLRLTLDKDKGQHIAQELDRLYAYVVSRVLDGSTKLDPGAIEEAIKVLSNLLPAWEEIARKEQEQLVPPALLATMAIPGGFQLQG
ncbi:MAG TPA: flagellar export chaperone FliS [Terriglobia bacterium]|nr:flagellar export chaperone FliS [Terriglobia bacterium]